MKYVIDAYAWVEYFNGSKLGEKVKTIVEDVNNKIYTNIITLAELSSFFNRNNKDFYEAQKIISSLSSIFSFDVGFSIEVGELHAKLKKDKKHIGLADIFVLITSRKLKAKLVTGDEDFRGLNGVFMIK